VAFSFPFEHNTAPKRVPKFWVLLSEKLEDGLIKSPKIVYDELVAGNDELANWCKQRREKGLCVAPGKVCQARYGEICDFVEKKYPPRHVAEFLRGADGWVIAHAMASPGSIVVTQETPRNDSYRGKIKVPTVCKLMSVTCKDTFEFLDILDARF